MKRAFSELDLISRYPFLSSNPILIDVGAHHGFVSRTFALKGWHVIAFEPEKQNRAAFLLNNSAFQNVTCINKAVSDKSNEMAPFYVSEKHFGIHSLKPFHETHELAYEVETVRLDDTLESMNVMYVTFLKIDTEGADFLALKGLDINKYRPELVMLEFMDTRSLQNFNYDHHDVVSHMKTLGYSAFISEWAPIEEYAQEGMTYEPHKWLQCVPYPLEHNPAWGNLIFVPEKDQIRFSRTLENYLTSLNSPITLTERMDRFKAVAGKIPGARWLYRMFLGS